MEVANGSPISTAFGPMQPHSFCGEERVRRTPSPRRRGCGQSHGEGRRRRIASGWIPPVAGSSSTRPTRRGQRVGSGGETASFAGLELSTANPFAVLVATSISIEPISSTKRLLVSAIAQVEPTGFRWVNEWNARLPTRDAPLPSGARHGGGHLAAKGTVRGYVLNNEGDRVVHGYARGLAGRRRRDSADRRQDTRVPLGIDGRMTR